MGVPAQLLSWAATAVALLLFTAAVTLAPQPVSAASAFSTLSVTSPTLSAITTNSDVTTLEFNFGLLPAATSNDAAVKITLPAGSWLHPTIIPTGTQFTVNSSVLTLSKIVCNGENTDIVPPSECRINDPAKLGQPGAPTPLTEPITLIQTYISGAAPLATMLIRGLALPSYPASAYNVTFAIITLAGGIVYEEVRSLGAIALGTDFADEGYSVGAFQTARAAGALVPAPGPLSLNDVGALEIRGWADAAGSALRTWMFPGDLLTLTLPPALGWAPTAGAVDCAVCVGSAANCAESATVTGAAAPGLVTVATVKSQFVLQLALTYGQNSPYVQSLASTFSDANYKLYCTGVVIRGLMTDSRVGVQYFNSAGVAKTVAASVPLSVSPVTATAITGAVVSYPDGAPASGARTTIVVTFTAPAGGVTAGGFVRVQLAEGFMTPADGSTLCNITGAASTVTYRSDIMYSSVWVGANAGTAIAAGATVTLTCNNVNGPSYVLPSSPQQESVVQITIPDGAAVAQGDLSWPPTVVGSVPTSIISTTPEYGSPASNCEFHMELPVVVPAGGVFSFTLPTSWQLGSISATACDAYLKPSNTRLPGDGDAVTAAKIGGLTVTITLRDAIDDGSTDIMFLCPGVTVPTVYDPSPTGQAASLVLLSGPAVYTIDTVTVVGGTLGPFGSRLASVELDNPVPGALSTMNITVAPMYSPDTFGAFRLNPGLFGSVGITDTTVCSYYADNMPFAGGSIITFPSFYICNRDCTDGVDAFPETAVLSIVCTDVQLPITPTDPGTTVEFILSTYNSSAPRPFDELATASATITPIVAGQLGDVVKTIQHTPSLAGTSGTLAINVGGMPINVYTFMGIYVKLPTDWTFDFGGESTYTITVSDNTTVALATPGAVDVSTLGNEAYFWFADTTSIPARSTLHLVVTNVRPLAQSAGTASATLSLVTETKNVVSSTTTATVAPVDPAVLGEFYALVTLTDYAANAATNVTFHVDGFVNRVPQLGRLNISLPATAAYFPAPTVGTTMVCVVSQPSTGFTTTAAHVDSSASQIAMILDATEVNAIPALVGAITLVTCDKFTNPAAPDYETGEPLTVTSATNALIKIDTGANFSLAGWAVTMTLVQSPNFAIAGVALAPTIVLALTDQFGKPATKGKVTVSIDPAATGTPSGAALAGTLVVSVAAGKAEFTNVIFDTVASGIALIVSYPGLDSIRIGPFDVLPLTALARLRFVVAPYLLAANEVFPVACEADNMVTGLKDPLASVSASLLSADGVSGAAGTAGAVLDPASNTAVSVAGTLTFLEPHTATLGVFTLRAQSLSAAYADAISPRFTVVATAAERDAELQRQDRKAARVTFRVIGATDALLSDAALKAAVELHIMTVACQYTPLAALDQCDRLTQIAFIGGDNGAFTIRVAPNPNVGERPNALEVAEILRSLVIDLTSPLHGGGGSGGVGVTVPGNVTFGSDPNSVVIEEENPDNDAAWIALIVTASVLGAAVLFGVSSVVYRKKTKYTEFESDNAAALEAETV